MLEQDWRKPLIKDTPQTELKKNSIKLYLKKSVLEKIEYLCNRIHDVEWSGILLYSVKGSIKDLETVEFHAEDIIPMDKGSQGYTEYTFNKKSLTLPDTFEDKYIDYVNEKEEALEWKIGHIHSHNNIGVFFSGTDTSEIEENSKNHNFYLSLIVNNRLNTLAKVAISSEIKHTFEGSFKARDENGEEYIEETREFTYKESLCKVYDCQIIKEEKEVILDSIFLKSVDSIIKEKELIKKEISVIPKFIKPLKSKNIFNNLHLPKKEENIIDFSFFSANNSELENFIIYILNNGEPDDSMFADFITLLEEDIKIGEWGYNTDTFISKYHYYYRQFFSELSEDVEYFIDLTEAVIREMKELSLRHKFLVPLANGLDKFLVLFKKM